MSFFIAYTAHMNLTPGTARFGSSETPVPNFEFGDFSVPPPYCDWMNKLTSERKIELILVPSILQPNETSKRPGLSIVNFGRKIAVESYAGRLETSKSSGTREQEPEQIWQMEQKPQGFGLGGNFHVRFPPFNNGTLCSLESWVKDRGGIDSNAIPRDFSVYVSDDGPFIPLMHFV